MNIFTFISEKFNSFVSRGTDTDMNELDRKHIWLLNVFYLVATFTYVAAVVQTYFVDGIEEGHFVLATGILFEFSLIFILLKKYPAAQLYMVLTSNITLFVFENRYGPDAGTHLYYFPLAMMIAFLVDFRKFQFAVFNILITIAFIIAAAFLQKHFLYHDFPDSDESISFRFNLIISGIMTAALALSVIFLSYRQYNEFLSRMEERRKSEESMKLVIREKETLLAEIHHRVKNNLAVISSLLNLQMNTEENEYTRDVLRESRNRVTSMSLIHQKLYKNTNVEEIDFGKYATDLVDEIRYSYPNTVAENTEVNVHAAQAKLPLTVAVPCGLILNELLSNCYKHAFTAGQHGVIDIQFGNTGSDENTFRLEVSDNGKGLPAGFDMMRSESLGLTIIQSLAEQIDAKWSMKNGAKSGTVFQMEFRRTV